MNTTNYLPVVSVDMLHYGKLTADTTAEIKGETPKRIHGLTEAGFNRNGSVSTFFADGGPYCTATAGGEIDGAIACADVPPELKSELYGDKYDSQTGELLMGDFNSPEIFIQYRIQKANGAFRYVTVFKCKCVDNSDGKIQTKGGSINFQQNGFAFKASNTLYNGHFCRILDDDDTNLPSNVTPAIIASKWFTDINWKIAAE